MHSTTIFVLILGIWIGFFISSKYELKFVAISAGVMLFILLFKPPEPIGFFLFLSFLMFLLPLVFDFFPKLPFYQNLKVKLIKIDNSKGWLYYLIRIGGLILFISMYIWTKEIFVVLFYPFGSLFDFIMNSTF